ncbi:MAG: hypothetical protein LBS01_11480 [Prevotellaceae bacterium]|jgi:hypothetical protein|nr:hypothetical protein [Prevotellaceae bacterium]
MKKVVLFFAVVASVAIFASCGPKQAANTDDVDSTAVAVVDTAVVPVDSAAVVADTAAVTPAQ